MEENQRRYCFINKSNDSSEESQEDDINQAEIVDSLKYFTVASKSRFVSWSLKKNINSHVVQ